MDDLEHVVSRVALLPAGIEVETKCEAPNLSLLGGLTVPTARHDIRRPSADPFRLRSECHQTRAF